MLRTARRCPLVRCVSAMEDGIVLCFVGLMVWTGGVGWPSILVVAAGACSAAMLSASSSGVTPSRRANRGISCPRGVRLPRKAPSCESWEASATRCSDLWLPVRR